MNPPTHTNCLETTRAVWFIAVLAIVLGVVFAVFTFRELGGSDDAVVLGLAVLMTCAFLAGGCYGLLRIPRRFCWDDTGFVNVGLFGRQGRRVAWSEVVALERSLDWFRARLSDGRCVRLHVNVVPEPQRYMDVLATHLGHLIDAGVVAAEQRGEFVLGKLMRVRWQPSELEWGAAARRKRVAFASLCDVERRFMHHMVGAQALVYTLTTRDGKTETLVFAGAGFLTLDRLIQRSLPQDVVLVDHARGEPGDGVDDVRVLTAALRAEERKWKALRRGLPLALVVIVLFGAQDFDAQRPLSLTVKILLVKVGGVVVFLGVAVLPLVIRSARKRRDLRQRLEKLGTDPGVR